MQLQNTKEHEIEFIFPLLSQQTECFFNKLIDVYFQDNNIFQSLSSDDYRLVIHLIEAAIISTDLALYFK